MAKVHPTQSPPCNGFPLPVADLSTALPELLSAISDASFVSIDAEMTGLQGRQPPPSAADVFDTPEERYLRLVYSSLDFLLVQFGLATFTYNPDQSRFSVPLSVHFPPRPTLSMFTPALHLFRICTRNKQAGFSNAIN